MTCECGGAVVEITIMDDREAVFLCTDCGHQGPAREFPDPEPEPKPGLIARARMRLAELIAPRV